MVIPYHVPRLCTKYSHSSFADLWTYYTMWCNSGLIPCMPGDMLIFSLADKTTNSTLLLPKPHLTTCQSFLLSLCALPTSEETWKKKEWGLWCSRTRQERASKERTKAIVWHVTIMHPRDMVSEVGGGGCLMRETHNVSSESRDWALASVAFILCNYHYPISIPLCWTAVTTFAFFFRAPWLIH